MMNRLIKKLADILSWVLTVFIVYCGYTANGDCDMYAGSWKFACFMTIGWLYVLTYVASLVIRKHE